MTQLQVINKTISENNNIISRKDHSKWVFKNVNRLSCIHCNRTFPFSTTQQVYLLNGHGWIICDSCMVLYSKEGDKDENRKRN